MRNIINTDGLVKNGLISFEEKKRINEVAAQFSIAISPNMQSQIIAKNSSDPIFAQFVPDYREVSKKKHEIHDPIGDDIHEKLKGLVHRYENRVLIKLNNFCPVYCRFCFRREKIGRDKALGLNKLQIDEIIEYIGQNTQIKEVILSGGDPLIYGQKLLAYFCEAIDKLTNVEILRIHTRVPIVSPELIGSSLLGSIGKFTKAKFIILHTNHIQEINEAAQIAIKKIQNENIILLSQTVLLKGINANSEILANLFNKLISLQIKPYYLHHSDFARGTSHFQIGLFEGLEIYQNLKPLVSGIALPRYVLDIPNGFGKIDINSDNVKTDIDGNYLVCDKNKIWHKYPNINLI